MVLPPRLTAYTRDQKESDALTLLQPKLSGKCVSAFSQGCGQDEQTEITSRIFSGDETLKIIFIFYFYFKNHFTLFVLLSFSPLSFILSIPSSTSTHPPSHRNHHLLAPVFTPSFLAPAAFSVLGIQTACSLNGALVWVITFSTASVLICISIWFADRSQACFCFLTFS